MLLLMMALLMFLGTNSADADRADNADGVVEDVFDGARMLWFFVLCEVDFANGTTTWSYKLWRRVVVRARASACIEYNQLK